MFLLDDNVFLLDNTAFLLDDTAFLLDDTADARALVPNGAPPPVAAGTGLTPEDRRAWTRLGGSPGPASPLITKWPSPFWKRVYVVDTAGGSQFDALNALLDENAAPPAPAAAIAITGFGFHGHRGRGWAVLRGNLHLSVLFTPEGLAARDALSVVMLPAVATADAITTATAGAVRPGIKWVNDLLVDGKKVAGVLAATKSEGDRLTAAILGVGINVERTPKIPSTPFVPATVSLAERPGCRAIRLADLVGPILESIESRYRELLAEGPAPLLEAYRGLSVVRGRRVRIYPEGIDDESAPDTWPQPLASGVVTAIGADLSLELEGHPDPVNRGRLAFPENGPGPGAGEPAD